MSYPIVFSFVQAQSLLAAKKQGQSSLEISPDLNISMVTVQLTDEGILFPQGEWLNWQDVQKIQKSTSNCFVLENHTMRAIQVFSEETQRVCSLLPTKHTPSMLIAGFTMHRIVDIDPMQDTLKKIATIMPVIGRVLDTATGLGYTAIEAAKTADEVVTIELDPGAQVVARLNPWSRELFRHPKIKQIMGNAFDVIATFESESFARIVHDPPVLSLAGELYSGVFYQQLFRVLQRGGRLFHYVGDLNSKSSGTVTRGVLKRLQEAGFTRVVRRPEAFGVLAYK